MRARTIRERGPRHDPSIKDAGIVWVGQYEHGGVGCTKKTLTFRRPSETIDEAKLRCEGCGAALERGADEVKAIAEVSRSGVMRWRRLIPDAAGNDVPAGPWQYVPIGGPSVPLVLPED